MSDGAGWGGVCAESTPAVDGADGRQPSSTTTYKAARIPSYCDRVLYKSMPSCAVCTGVDSRLSGPLLAPVCIALARTRAAERSFSWSSSACCLS